MAAKDIAKITIQKVESGRWALYYLVTSRAALKSGDCARDTTYVDTFPTNLPIQGALTKHLQRFLYSLGCKRVYVVDCLEDGTVETTVYDQSGERRLATAPDRKMLLSYLSPTPVTVEVNNRRVNAKAPAPKVTAAPKAGTAPKTSGKAPKAPGTLSARPRTAPPRPRLVTSPVETPRPTVSNRGGRGMAHPGLHAGGEAYRVFVHELKLGGMDFATSRELWKSQPKKITPDAATKAARALLQARTKTNRVRPDHIKTPA